MASLIGQIISGRFRIVRQLGGGAMGEVYLAEHLMLGRLYAIKVLHESLEADDRLVERFRREARAASRLDHPNIVSITDFGRIDPTDDVEGTESGRFYLVMEHVEGPSLAQAIDEAAPRRLPQQRSVLILSQICEAVHAAHGAGVVHRDLKPDNILLGRRPSGSDHVKVLDFGLAKILQDPTMSQLTRKGEVFGTPAYMSPEQARGATVDHRADIYSIGVIAYELFAGRLPFLYNNISKLLIAHQQEQPAPPSHHLLQGQPPVPRDIEGSIMRCLAKDPAGRMQSIQEMSEVLATYVRRISVTGTRIVPNVLMQDKRESGTGFDLCEVTDAAMSVPTRATMLGDALLEEISDEDIALLATQLPSKARPISDFKVPPGASRDWFWSQIIKHARSLGHKLATRLAGSEALAASLSTISNIEDKILGLETEVALTRSQLDEFETTMRESESRLRFAVMDLSVERGRLVDEGRAGPPVLQDLDYQIQALETRLLQLYNDRSKEVAELVGSIEACEQHLANYRQQQVNMETWLLNQLHHLRPDPCPEDLQLHYARIDQFLRGMQSTQA